MKGVRGEPTVYPEREPWMGKGHTHIYIYNKGNAYRCL
jgi:hypothetical protein